MKHYTIEQIQTMQVFAQEANNYLARAWTDSQTRYAVINNWLERANNLPIEFDAVDFNEFCDDNAVDYETFWQFYLAYQIEQCKSIARQYHDSLQQLRTRNKIAGMRARACRQTVLGN